MVNVDGDLYHWNNRNMTIWDLKNWSELSFGELPEEFLRPGRCATVEIGGYNGIMTR